MQQLFEPLTPYTQYHDYLLQKYSVTSAVDKESFWPLLKELEDAISTLLIQILSQDDDGSINCYYDALKVLTVIYGRVQESQGAGSANIGVSNSISTNAGVNGASISKVNGDFSPNSSVMNGGGNHAVDNSVIQLSDSNILNVSAPTVLGSLGGGQYVKNHSTAAFSLGLTTGNGGSYATNLANNHPSNHVQGHVHGHGYNNTTSTSSGLLDRDNSGGNASSQLLNTPNAGVNTAGGGGNPAAAAPTTTDESLELHDMYDTVPVSANSGLTVNGLLHQQQLQDYHRQQQPQNHHHHHMPLQVSSQHQHHSQQHQQIQHLPTPQQHSHHHPQQPPQQQQQQQTYYYPLNYSNTNTTATAVQPSSTHTTSSHNSTNNTSSNNNLRYYQQNLGSAPSFNHNSPAAANGGHSSSSSSADYNQQQYFYTLQRYPYLPPIPSQHHNAPGPGTSNTGHGHHASGGVTSVNGGGPAAAAAPPGAGTGFQNYLLDFNFTN
jgi:hypothetical protein